MYEVELKFPLHDLDDMECRLRELGAVEHSRISQVDRYYNHPSRDFRSTDEAFRIRSTDDTNVITYKSAVIGDVAKTRQEIEVTFADGPESLRKLTEIVRMLGFRFVREVKKSRRHFSVAWAGRDYDVCLDEVPPLGTFLEIELMANESDRQLAEADVWKLAGTLGLFESEPRSYLKLLLESDGPG